MQSSMEYKAKLCGIQHFNQTLPAQFTFMVIALISVVCATFYLELQRKYTSLLIPKILTQTHTGVQLQARLLVHLI